MADKRGTLSQLLASNLAAFKQGKDNHLALLGSKRSGKTRLLKKSFDTVSHAVPVYIDLNRISLSPENFAVEFLSKITLQFFNKDWRNQVLDKAPSLNNTHLTHAAATISNELQKIKPDHHLILQTVFDLIENLAQQKKIVIYVDNFEHIFALNNFSAVKNILSFFHFDNKNVRYIVSSASAYLLEHTLKNFDFIKVPLLDKKETAALAQSITSLSLKELDRLFSITKGQPYLVKNICRRYEQVKDLRRAAAAEFTLTDSATSLYFDFMLTSALHKARGASLLKTIIHVLALEGNLRLSEIARKIYRSAPVTKSLLERLVEVDLISRTDDKYHFNDTVLKLWLKLTLLNHSYDTLPENTKAIEAMLDEV